METHTTFKFSLDERVKTLFEELGVISMLGFDESGNVYYVKTKDKEGWYKEKHLSLI